MSAYAFQSVKHDASITAYPHPTKPNRIVVEITRGERKPTRIVMWDEDFETMTREALNL